MTSVDTREEKGTLENSTVEGHVDTNLKLRTPK